LRSKNEIDDAFRLSRALIPVASVDNFVERIRDQSVTKR
jgi:hypothetical protein